MANHLRVNFIAVILLFMMTVPPFIFAQNKHQFSLWSQVNGEYRDNIIRYPDSLKVRDYRTNLFFLADYHKKNSRNSNWRFSYELRYHRYVEYKEYTRHDHLLRGVLRKPIYGTTKLHIANEFRVRYYSSSSIFNYRRNILDSYISMKVPFLRQLSLGYQNWLKTYPNGSSFQTYLSNRYFIRMNRRMSRTAHIGVKFELQKHQGNLYPGSTAPDQLLNLKGYRYVFHFVFDKIITPKILANVVYRFENDRPEDSDVNQIGENVGDENTKELLTEDYDFGYSKHQFTFSALFKINPRISFLTFYLFQHKKFHYWQINTNGPNRKDKLLFFSNILKIKLYKSIGIEFQYNFEHNYTNLLAYKYMLNSISLGLFWQP